MALIEDLKRLTTEAVNPRTINIDMLATEAILRCINDEDRSVAGAVAAVVPNIARVVDAVVRAINAGGRLIYVGAGTSGRLGVVDASECPPTFGTDPDVVQAVIAGGPQAVFRSQEGVEDSRTAGAEALVGIGVAANDVVVGIAASGRTPFVLGAIAEAKRKGATTALVSTNEESIVQALAPEADILVCPVVGPEVIAGSTRMKSGTAQKLVLNMISTTAMIRLGKTYGNIMVDLQQSNAKLVARSTNIVATIAGISTQSAEALLTESGGHVKTAIVMALCACSRETAQERLRVASGHVRSAIGQNLLQSDDTQ